jgi:hypothetical protein
MLEFMKVRACAALAVVIAISRPVLSQSRVLSLCIVQTKSQRMAQYDPPAGPFAVAMYRELAGQRLQSGAALHIVVLPASVQSDILPEIQRLRCSWVLQLWYEGSTDYDVFNQVQPRGLSFGSLLFTLWNGATRKAVENGAGIVSLGKSTPMPFAGFRKQILKKLNQLP